MIVNFLKRAGLVASDWQQVDANVYTNAYQEYGGSFLTHPMVIDAMSSMASIETKFYGCYKNDHLAGALATWGSYLAGDKRYLQKIKQRRLFDVGNAEVILPVSRHIKVPVDYKGQFISEINNGSIINLKKQKESLSLARSFSQGDFSRKFRYNRRRELKHFKESGGEVIPLSELSANEIAIIYTKLFRKRWGKKPKGHEQLSIFLEKIFPMVKGYYLRMNDIPVAIQLIYLVSTQCGVSAEYINGGVDLDYKKFSPGSILSFLNIQMAEDYAQSNNTPLRFSFGLTDKDYKSNWCLPHPVFMS